MTQPMDPQYAAYLAWQAQQAAAAPPPPPAPVAPPMDPGYAAYLAAQHAAAAGNGHLPTGGAAAADKETEIIYGGLDDYANQQSGGGAKGWRFVHETNRNPLLGITYEGIVDRDVVGGPGGDIEAITDNEGNVRTQRDGKTPKFVMRVTMRMVPTPLQADGSGHPDGFGSLYLQGDRAVKVNAAMAEVGLPEGAPPKGTWIRLRLVRTQPIKDRNGKPLNPKFIYEATVRGPADPWSIEQTQLIDAAHRQLEAEAEAVPAEALQPPPPGSPPQAYVAYAQALAASQAPIAAAVPAAAPPPPPPIVAQPAPAAVTPPAVAPPVVTTPPAASVPMAVTTPVAAPPAASVPAASNGAQDAETAALQAAAAQMGLNVDDLIGLDTNARRVFLDMVSKAPATA